jgi:hypothetical protein
MFIAGYDVKQIIGSLLAIVFIFAGMFSAALLLRNLGRAFASRDATERSLWTWRWVRPALALFLCALATYLVFVYVLA